VLGANDGIVSTAAVVVGVAGATSEVMPVFLAGSAALVGGAISMALGEYVSVSSQRDSEHARSSRRSAVGCADPEANSRNSSGSTRSRASAPRRRRPSPPRAHREGRLESAPVR
jgi:VIT1/CCC1 family predicted Fe2+/Mn2+ transporter